MKDQLISLDTAKLAKEKGFDIFEFDEKLKTAIFNNGKSFHIDTKTFKDKYYAYVNDTLYLIETGTLDSRYGSFNDFLTEYKYKNGDVFSQAPTQSLLQKWLREEHKLNVEITHHGWNKADKHFSFRSIVKIITKKKISDNNGCKSDIPGDFYIFRSYESALEKGLQEALKLIK